MKNRVIPPCKALHWYNAPPTMDETSMKDVSVHLFQSQKIFVFSPNDCFGRNCRSFECFCDDGRVTLPKLCVLFLSNAWIV